MTPSLYLLFKEGFLQMKVILPTEKTSHATIGIFDVTDQGTLCMHPLSIESMLFQSLFECGGS